MTFEQKKRPRRLTRRRFVGQATAAAAALAAPTIIPASALGRDGRTAPSERIVMGAIGLGGRGSYDLGALMWNEDVQMVAICDVRGDRREAAQRQVNAHYENTDCRAYIDLRELLARPDIDAVLIATGDNWHTPASLLAARAGKDIYSEKPISVTIAESRELADTIRRHGRVLQCGTQRRNVGNFVFAVNLARSGRLGKLTDLHAEKYSPDSTLNFDILPEEPLPPRDVMAWDLWLGVAPWRPYNSRTWQRGFWMWHGDFSGGSITEWGSHTVDLCQWANDADDTNPIEYESINEQGDVRAVYANGVRLHLRKGLRFGSCPVRFEGEEGWVETGDSGQIAAEPASLLAERAVWGGYPADDHIREFLDCVHSRRQPSANAEAAHRSISACHAANIAVRLGRPVRWDPEAERFLDDDEANRLASRAFREPWRL